MLLLPPALVLLLRAAALLGRGAARILAQGKLAGVPDGGARIGLVTSNYCMYLR